MTIDSTSDVQPALQPGDKISYFEVQNPLAVGGMSLVWKGRDSVLNRDVAIKQLITADQADEALRERFRTEAEMQKKVSASHPNLVQIIEYIEEERGLFIVMEYVDGSSLDRVLAKLDGPMDPKQALGILHQSTVALQAIHKAGVLHRDLKPANILLPREGGVKLCDFGLATLAESQETLTMGTARYMAPELFTESDADGRADVYSLGMVAYEMLIGKPKFEEQFRTVLRDQRNQALRWMKWHTNARLTAAPISRLMPDLPAELSDVVERMMAKDRSVRIDSAQTLLEVLKRNFSSAGRAQAQAEAAQQAAASRITSPSEPTAPLPKRSKTPLILAGVLLAQVVIIGGIFAYLEAQKGEEAEKRIAAAQQAYGAARVDFQAKDYETARAGFNRVIETYADVPEWPLYAQVRAHMCTGFIERARGNAMMDARQYADAREAYLASRVAFEKADDAIPADHVKLGGERTEINEQRKRSIEYYAFAEPASRINDLIAAGQLNEAREQIRLLRETKDKVEREEQILETFTTQIVRLEQIAREQKVIADANQLDTEGQLDDAILLLEDARDRMNTSVFDQLIREKKTKRSYAEALDDARRAEERGNLAEAIVQYETVLSIRPDESLRRQLAALKSQHAYAEGKRRQAEGDINGAVEKFNESNNHLQNDLATRALAELGRQANKNDKVQQGDVALASGDFPQAINAYKAALLINYDADTDAKLTRAQTRLYADRAERALMAWRLAEAREAVNEALRLTPSDPQAGRTKTTLDIAIEYQALVDDGEALYSKGKYGDAGRKFRQAYDVIKNSNIDSDPISKRVKDAEYESWMIKARTAVEAQQWKIALANVKAAINTRETKEAVQLRSDILNELEE